STQMPRQRTSVHLGDSDDTLLDQHVSQRTGRLPAGTDTSGFPHHVTGHPDTLRLTVLVVPAGITDMRGGLHDYLPMVRGIGQRFLITGHARREHDLTQRATGGTVRRPTKYGAVLEHQRRGHALGHRRCHSCSSILIVWNTYTRS